MIVGTLSWFNESTTWLTRTVASLAKVCDHVVVADGRYALFQHDMNWSPAPEAEAVLAAAEGVGVPLTLHIPRVPFHGNEVEKRNLLLRLAKVYATTDRDWIFVCDADEYVVHASPDLPAILDDVAEDVAICLLEEYFDPFTQLGQADGGVAKHLPIPNTWRADVRRFYRALHGLEYRGTHYRVGGFSHGEWVWLDGPGKCQAHFLRDDLILRHENPRRVELRRQQASAYYATRDRLEIESENELQPIA